jgi:nucleoid-associated protein YgaU
MGKFEKIVVLAVLFLVTLILVVSMNTGELEGVPHAAIGGGVELGEPALTAEPVSAAELEAPDEAPVEVLEVAPVSFDPSGALLSGQVEALAVVEASSAVEAPAVVEASAVEASAVEAMEAASGLSDGALLITLEGLVETPEPGHYWHTCAEGDTYKSLARLYYGDPSFYALLQHVNDAWGSAPVGDTVIIPAFDVRVSPRGRRVRHVDPQPIGSGVTYRVLEGDNLWKISVKHYGKGTKNLEIYEANRDVLKSEDALRPGMLLQIP